MPRELDSVSLRLFVAVCDERNIARAAAREAIVASAVSKRIAALEAELGTPLVVRGRRGIEPTAAGELLLRQARELIDQMTRLRAELAGFAGGVQGSVRVLASVSALAEELPDDVAAFLAGHPRVSVSLAERVSADIVRALRGGAADLGVLWDAADRDGLRSVPYREDHLVVALPAAHALAARKRLRFDDVLGEPLINVATGGLMDALLRRQAALRGRAPEYRLQVSSLDAACRLVAAGLGLAILPREATAAQSRAAGLAMRPLHEAWARRRFVVCSRAGTTLSAPARLLLEHLEAAASAR
ncbi:MAG: LysR substrate-binding domain-containing protein [Burkholderiaceae bacterium]